jgi:hypothetical protein
MTFDELLTQVLELLQRDGRVSYRALRRRFDLDEEYLEDLKAEIIQAKKLAVDEDGAVLVWTGGTTTPPAPASEQERCPRGLEAPCGSSPPSRAGRSFSISWRCLLPHLKLAADPRLWHRPAWNKGGSSGPLPQLFVMSGGSGLQHGRGASARSDLVAPRSGQAADLYLSRWHAVY